MATTTTNYGFDVPTSSDLVKNGATAISTLGQDIDTFLFRPFTRNAVLNSGFNVWQRGTSILAGASVSAYQADRWQGYSASANITVSRQATNDTTNLPFIQYCARAQRTAGNSSVGGFALTQNIETVNSIPYAGKQVTFSFYARAGANFSSTSSILKAVLGTGTGTDQNWQAGFTGFATPINQNATLTTTWQRFTYTATLASSITQIATYFEFTPTGTAGANDYFEVTGVQIEVGNQVSPYAPATPTYATELAACQRYYVRFGTGNVFEQIGFGMASDVTYVIAQMPLPVSMRVTPSAIDFSTLRVVDTQNASTVSSVTFDIATRTSTLRPILKFTTSGSLTQYRPYFIEANNSTSGYLGLSAEL